MELCHVHTLADQCNGVIRNDNSKKRTAPSTDNHSKKNTLIACINTFKCRECSKTFPSKRRLDRHSRLHKMKLKRNQHRASPGQRLERKPLIAELGLQLPKSPHSYSCASIIHQCHEFGKQFKRKSSFYCHHVLVHHIESPREQLGMKLPSFRQRRRK